MQLHACLLLFIITTGKINLVIVVDLSDSFMREAIFIIPFLLINLESCF